MAGRKVAQKEWREEKSANGTSTCQVSKSKFWCPMSDQQMQWNCLHTAERRRLSRDVAREDDVVPYVVYCNLVFLKPPGVKYQLVSESARCISNTSEDGTEITIIFVIGKECIVQYWDINNSYLALLPKHYNEPIKPGAPSLIYNLHTVCQHIREKPTKLK